MSEADMQVDSTKENGVNEKREEAGETDRRDTATNQEPMEAIRGERDSEMVNEDATEKRSEPTTSSEAQESQQPAQPPPLGKRAKQTNQLVQMALKHIVDGWSYNNFAESFPAIAKDAPESLSSMREQTKDHFELSVKSSIDALHQRRRVIESLNSLDELLSEVSKSKRDKGVNYKRKGDKLANDPFLAHRVRQNAVLRKEHKEMDHRLDNARREMDELVHGIKEMEKDEESGEKDKRELDRLLGIVNEGTATIPQEEMRVVQAETELML
ncbi:hypothetical protein E3P99_01517 [Wallemia hederae]|uniref:Uncharacterized protein n=1 Tax=Wallemia hederae TaxID=1540922 RepID=A0A4T0FSD4_9BASI|nr:hypothetical protein E3P99_01517 [Wallemia hederae]